VRDFREAEIFDVNVGSNGAISFSTDKRFPHENFSYDFTILSLALFTGSEDADEHFATLPYLIGGKDKKILSKGLLILDAAQRRKLKEVITARLGSIV
jgi:hypothetical protein